MSVNKLLTFINTKKTVNTATSKLSVSSENYYTVTLTLFTDPKNELHFF